MKAISLSTFHARLGGRADLQGALGSFAKIILGGWWLVSVYPVT